MLIKFDNGTEVEFDAYDAETADTYDSFLKSVDETSEKLKSMADENPGDAIRLMFGVVSDGCDALFGSGMGAKICGERPNMIVALAVFGKIRESQDAQIEEMRKLSYTSIEKYGGSDA